MGVCHDEIVARAVSCERGALIEATGERTFSVFRVASDALRAITFQGVTRAEPVFALRPDRAPSSRSLTAQ